MTGIDISETMLEQAREKHGGVPNLAFRQADATKPFAQGDADVAVYSAVLHEIYSYSGDSFWFVRKAMKATFASLQQGGRVVIRDFFKPEHGNREVIIEQDLDQIREGQSFADFVGAFDKTRSRRRIPAQLVSKEGNVVRYKTRLTFAVEYLLRKDYPSASWKAELDEHYLFWTQGKATRMLDTIGFKTVHTEPLPRSSKLEDLGPGTRVLDRDGNEIEMPSDKALIVAEKPRRTMLSLQLLRRRRSRLPPRRVQRRLTKAGGSAAEAEPTAASPPIWMDLQTALEKGTLVVEPGKTITVRVPLSDEVAIREATGTFAHFFTQLRDVEPRLNRERTHHLYSLPPGEYHVESSELPEGGTTKSIAVGHIDDDTGKVRLGDPLGRVQQWCPLRVTDQQPRAKQPRRLPRWIPTRRSR